MRRCIPVFLILISALMFWKVRAWGSNKVLLKDVTALTLHKGQMTTGRRSSPVPQLKCVGGSAGCYKFTPQTVQCRNAGFDGNEVQWECKCDMDDSYRFGKVQVTCEGYDYPDDPYILKGSCGLEYAIDYTEAGRARSSDYSPSWSSNDSDGGGWIFFFILIFVIVFMICKMGGNHDDSRAPYPEAHRPDHSSDSRHTGHNNPPPYGFKREYTQPQPEYQPPPPSYADATQDPHRSSTYTRTRNAYHSETTNSPNGGGFWTGLGLGGIGGYLFGSRRRNHYNGNPSYGGYWGNNRGWGSSWGNNGGWGSSWGNNGGWGSSSTTYRRSTGSSSSGTSRTTSGYGGTSRR